MPEHLAQGYAHSTCHGLHCTHPYPHPCIEILTRIPQNATLFGKQVAVDVISQDKVLVEQVSPHPIHLESLLKKRGLDTGTHTGRTLCENEGRDWGDASIKKSQGSARTCQKSGKEQGPDSSLGSQRNQLSQHLNLGLAASRTGRKQIAIFKSPSLWYFVNSSPSKLIHCLLNKAPPFHSTIQWLWLKFLFIRHVKLAF